MKNGQSKDTDNIGHTRHRTKTIKKITTQKSKKLSNTEPTNNRWREGEHRCSPTTEGERVNTGAHEIVWLLVI